MKDKNYKVIEAHYGPEHTFWRVVVSEKDREFQTVGKFTSKEEAENYIKIREQMEAKEHNQW